MRWFYSHSCHFNNEGYSEYLPDSLSSVVVLIVDLDCLELALVALVVDFVAKTHTGHAGHVSSE